MFINMNPYFDIYQYEGLDLDQTMWAFFNDKKNYKHLKEYESKVFSLKRELKESEVKLEVRQRELNVKVEEKDREIHRLIGKLDTVQASLTEITDSNVLLKDKVQHYQML